MKKRKGVKPEVLKLYRKKLSNREIAEMLNVSAAYVRKTINREKARLNSLDF